MFTLPQRKYVYPSLLFLFLLMLLLLRAGAVRGGETAPRQEPPREERNIFGIGQHSERDFIDAADRFNQREALFTGSMQDSLDDSNRDRDDRLAYQEEKLRRLQQNWRFSQFNQPESRDYYRNTQDSRYLDERRRLDEKRISDYNRYRADRRVLAERMERHDRTSPEHTRLRSELEQLDRNHVNRERGYERQYRTMDADYSISRW